MILSRALFWTILAIVLSSCSTFSLPVLRGETGETVGQNRIRLVGSLEKSRATPISGAIDPAAGLIQSASSFSGTAVRISGSYGVLPTTDFQIRATALPVGGGWRLGVKQSILSQGSLAVAGLFGWGRSAGSGTFDLATASGSLSVNHTLSATQWDFGFPVSYKFGKDWAAYSGFHYFHTSLSGVAGDQSVSAGWGEWGINLGLRTGLGSRFDVGGELMFLKVSGPYSDGVGFIPYFGLMAGLEW